MDNRFSPKNTTVIICCAGMGTRLGIGTTKALIDIEGKPLIIRLLEQLNQYDDIRIVVGFDYERVIGECKHDLVGKRCMKQGKFEMKMNLKNWFKRWDKYR